MTDAAELAAEVGLVLDPEQRLILEAMLARDAVTKRPVFEACVVEPRQNGKTWALMAAVLYDLIIAEDKLIVWSAHEFPTAMRSFKDFKNLIEASDLLSSRVHKVNNANGDEGFEFRGGQELRFRARTKAGGRGLAGDKVILDEAFALEDTHMGALLPILRTRKAAQVRYASSAGLPKSAVLRGLRDRGRAGGDPSLAYVEWCAPEDCAADGCDHARGVAGCACDNEAHWLSSNPSLRYRRDDWVEQIRNERRAIPPEEFAREIMGWWDDPQVGERPYDSTAWAALAEHASLPREGAVPVFALDVNPNRSRAVIGGCAGRVDGLAHVELQEYQSGTGGIVAAARALCDKHGAELVVLADGAAASLIPDLTEAGVKVRKYSTVDFAAACGLFGDGITGGLLRHIGQDELTDAIAVARKRERDGVWTLTRKGGDIAPLVACLLAYHAWSIDNNDYDVSASIF